MIKYIFAAMFIIHLLGDFYFQSEGMALKKENEFKWVVIHTIVYGVTAIALLNLFLPGMPCVYIRAIVFAHAIIDMTKYIIFCVKRKWTRINFINKRNLFFIDQVLHIIVIMIISYFMYKTGVIENYSNDINAIIDVIGISEITVLSWSVKLLLIHKPANITIMNIISAYKPEDENTDKNYDKKAGRLIGTLERILMVFFVSIEQYSAVGLVLTAKSIARYNRITEDQSFAEYYLLGTLLSTIIAVCVASIF